MRAAPPPARSPARRSDRGAGARRLALAATLALAGCGPTRRVADCRRVVAVVNPALDQIEAQARVPAESSAQYARIAASYLALDRELGALAPPRDPAVAALLLQYREHLERAAQLAQQLAVTPVGGGDGRRASAERELARLTERHRATSRQFDLACLGHR